MQVYYAILLERALLEPAADAFFSICANAGALGYKRITVPYGRTDLVRNRLAERFRAASQEPEDVLVMLDADHRHPSDIIQRLVEQVRDNVGVIGALTFRRGDDFRPCFYLRGSDGNYEIPANWPAVDCLRVPFVGTGAIAIRRWVFDKLDELGYGPAFFQYSYDYSPEYPTEDWWFAQICEQSGIYHHVNTRLISPHLGWKMIDEKPWQEWVKENLGKFVERELSDASKDEESNGNPAG